MSQQIEREFRVDSMSAPSPKPAGEFVVILGVVDEAGAGRGEVVTMHMGGLKPLLAAASLSASPR
jgi:hypothetical protein